MGRTACVALLAILVAVGCQGTDGTILVRHPAAGGAPATVEPVAGHAGEAASAAGSGGTGPVYVPAADSSWQAQLSGSIDPELAVELFYLDADFTEPAALEALRARGAHYVCYLSAGSFEPWREDAGEFPARVLGLALPDYPREQWLDVRDETVRALMLRRVEALARKGCEGIVPASLAVHTADTGFDLTLDDALEYAGWLASRIHLAGMSASLGAPLQMTTALAGDFDWGLAVDCLDPSGCAAFQPFAEQEKPVLHVEFGDAATAPALCEAARALGFDALIKRESFDGFRIACADIP
jgi:hypothetical protein